MTKTSVRIDATPERVFTVLAGSLESEQATITGSVPPRVLHAKLRRGRLRSGVTFRLAHLGTGTELTLEYGSSGQISRIPGLAALYRVVFGPPDRLALRRLRHRAEKSEALASEESDGTGQAA